MICERVRGHLYSSYLADELSVLCLLLQDMQHRSVVELVHALRMTDSYKMKAQILHILLNREGGHYRIEDSTVTQRLEALSQKAGLHRRWWVVRFCSALLGKLVDSLAPSITSILVRGKQVGT